MTATHLPPVALTSYSTKPRGGVAHMLALAETLHTTHHPIHVFALSADPEAGFFRPLQAPYTIAPAPTGLPDLETKVFAHIDALAETLDAAASDYPLVHTQDCISARAACRVRDAGRPIQVIRTVHHVDEFTSQALMDCQRQSIIAPDAVLTVSHHWRELLRDDYGIEASVAHNGIDPTRFHHVDPALTTKLRHSVGAQHRPLLLCVGGIEPRKGSEHLVRALAELKRTHQPPPVLAIIGGHSFQDHRPYRERVLGMLPELGLEIDNDIVVVGTVPDPDVPGWYAAADALAFPSVKEGWGLAVMEALSAGLPVVTSDLPVFREYLTHTHDALLVAPDDVTGLSDALASILNDSDLRNHLRTNGHAVTQRFTWEAAAQEHQQLYTQLQPRWDQHGAATPPETATRTAPYSTPTSADAPRTGSPGQ